MRATSHFDDSTTSSLLTSTTLIPYQPQPLVLPPYIVFDQALKPSIIMSSRKEDCLRPALPNLQIPLVACKYSPHLIRL